MKKHFAGVASISFLVAVLISLVALMFMSRQQSTQLVIGVTLSWANILFYSFMALLILHKKNIAWAMTIIVIKYLILVFALYYIWASTDVLIVLVGVFSQLLLTALSFIPLKRFVLS